MTKARREALDLLRAASQPLSAAAIFGRLGACCDQATVYRTLHYLEEQGYAESFILHCDQHGTERYYSAVGGAPGNEGGHRHWFHCESCHRFIEIGSCTVAGLVASFEKEQGVAVRHHVLYFTGLCPTCRQSQA
jgi:Fur family ferric uptake transcriptional regulator